MSQALPFVAIGLLLMAVLAVWVLRARARNRALAEPSEGLKDIDVFPLEVVPQRLTDRLFGEEDWIFISAQGSARLRRLFLQQRTELSLAWVRTVRANAKKLIHAHLTATRVSLQLEPLVELKVGADYLLFVMLCQLIALAISLRGPVHLRGLIRYTDGLSERLHELVANVLRAEVASEISNQKSYTVTRSRGG